MGEWGYRGISGSVADVDDRRRSVIADFPWDVLDTFKTSFAPDAFDEYLRRQLPIMLWQHDRKEPIGRATHWEKTQKANRFVAEFSDFDAVPRARQAFTQIRDGHLTDFSFYFDRATAVPHPNGERGALRFTHCRMPEISPVSIGSIPGAGVVGVRCYGFERDAILMDREEMRAAGLTDDALADLDRQEDLALLALFDKILGAGQRETQQLKSTFAAWECQYGSLPAAATKPKFHRDPVAENAWQHAIDGQKKLDIKLPPRQGQAPYDKAIYDAEMAKHGDGEIAMHMAVGSWRLELPMDQMPPPDIIANKPEGMSTDEMIRRWNLARWGRSQ
ncbi:MAG TPA: HK97 family phage prohead protease [Mycobacteriales bacterium]|nr:HK97 family phage prohead protease [Mycobacteriales bacterium]